MVAALQAGAEPVFVPAPEENTFLPDFASVPKDLLERTAIVYMCSPSNPQGAVASKEYWQELIALGEKYDFRVFADECYSEIYRDTPPTGALAAAQEMDADSERVVVFHSLSKRSNLPGLRSGFAAGGENSIAAMKQLRNYTGAPVPLPIQMVSAQCGQMKHMLKKTVNYINENLTFRIEFWETWVGILHHRPVSFFG